MVATFNLKERLPESLTHHCTVVLLGERGEILWKASFDPPVTKTVAELVDEVRDQAGIEKGPYALVEWDKNLRVLVAKFQ